jgi:magnesium chelatase subunit D
MVGEGDGGGVAEPDGSGAGDEADGDGGTGPDEDDDGDGDGGEDRPGELAGWGERDGRPEWLAPPTRCERALRPAPAECGPGEAGATTLPPGPEPGPGVPPGGRIAIVVAAARAASPAVTAMIAGGSTRYGCARTAPAQCRENARVRSSAIAAATAAAGRRGP